MADVSPAPGSAEDLSALNDAFNNAKQAVTDVDNLTQQANQAQIDVATIQGQVAAAQAKVSAIQPQLDQARQNREQKWQDLIAVVQQYAQSDLPPAATGTNTAGSGAGV